MIVYKYLPPEREEILSQFSLRLTPPDQLNDPLDCVASMTMPKNLRTLFQLWEQETRQLFVERTRQYPTGPRFEAFRWQCMEGRQRWLEWCLSNPDDRENLNAGMSLQAMFSQVAGVLCFSESADRTLMWSHYAKNHEGYVVGLDSSHSVFQTVPPHPSRLGTLSKVTYSDKRHQLGQTLEKADFDNCSYLFTKSRDWSYEAEWRLILPLWFGRTAGSVVVYDFPYDAVRQIVIGHRSSPELRAKLLKLKEKFSWIELLEARPSAVTFQMVLEEVSSSTGQRRRGLS